MKVQTIAAWIFRLAAAGIMGLTLFFKFTGNEQSVRLFRRLGAEPWGRIGTGILELIACILLLYPPKTVYGAALGMIVMAGAITSHVAILGVKFDGDYGLFTMACIVFTCCLLLLLMYRGQLLSGQKMALK